MSQDIGPKLLALLLVCAILVATATYWVWSQLPHQYTASAGPAHFADLLTKMQGQESTAHARVTNSLILIAQISNGYAEILIADSPDFAVDMRNYIEEFAEQHTTQPTTPYSRTTQIVGPEGGRPAIIQFPMKQDAQFGELIAQFCETLAVYTGSNEWTLMWYPQRYDLGEGVEVNSQLNLQLSELGH